MIKWFKRKIFSANIEIGDYVRFKKSYASQFHIHHNPHTYRVLDMDTDGSGCWIEITGMPLRYDIEYFELVKKSKDGEFKEQLTEIVSE